MVDLFRPPGICTASMRSLVLNISSCWGTGQSQELPFVEQTRCIERSELSRLGCF